MIQVNLKRLLSKKEVSALIDEATCLINSPLMIKDLDGRVLLGDVGKDDLLKHPISIGDKVIGWVFGGEKANVLASLLSHLATVEYDKKILGRETLEKYKEITLIYDSAEKLAASLDPKEVAQLVVDEVKKVIKADYVSIMLMNEETSIFEILAAAGKEYYPKVSLRAGEGIVGCVVLTGKAEIVNDVFSDSRYVVRVYYDKLFEAGDNGNA